MSIDRRRFLNETSRLAVAAAGLSGLSRVSFAQSTSSGNEKKAGPNDSVTVGLIGVGGRAQKLMKYAVNYPAAMITTVCDVNERNLARAAEAVGAIQLGRNPTMVRDFRLLLDDDSIDAVIIATPHHWHCPIAVRALQAGKHVYVEKPASHVFREGRLLARAAIRSRRVVQHGTQMRSSEVTTAAAKVLASGILGEIKMAKAWGVEPRRHPKPVSDGPVPDFLDWNRWLGPALSKPFNTNRHRRWNNYRDYGNGEMGGDGIHDIDLARWGLGVTTHPVRITAHGSRIHVKGESDFPDNMVVCHQYADAKVFIYENRNFALYRMHGWDNGNIFYGTDGYMVFSRRGYFQTYLGPEEEKGPGMRGGDGIAEHVHNFLDAVRNGNRTSADAEIAHLSCALVHLGEIAYRTGRVLHFDPQSETFPGDEQANALLTKDYRSPWGLDAG